MNVVTVGRVTIALIDGGCAGADFVTALACDVRVAADTATFAAPLTAAVSLARMLGEARAKDLVLTGRTFDAHEALRLGVVTRVVPAARLADEPAALVRGA